MKMDKIHKANELVRKLGFINEELSELKKLRNISTISFIVYRKEDVNFTHDPELINTLRISCIDRLKELSKQLTKEIEEL